MIANSHNVFRRVRTCASAGVRATGRAARGRVSLLGLTLVLALLATGLIGCVGIEQDQLPRAWRQDETREVNDWRDYDMSGLMEGDAWFTTSGSRHAGEIKGYGAGPAVFDSTGGYFELAVLSRRENVPVQQRVRVYFDDTTPVFVDDNQSTTVLNGIAKGEGYNVTRGKDVLEVPFYVNGGRLYAAKVNVVTDQRVEVP